MNFKTLDSWFESDLVAHREDRFSCDVAFITQLNPVILYPTLDKTNVVRSTNFGNRKSIVIILKNEQCDFTMME